MKLFIETCLDDFYISLIKDNKTIDYIHEKNLQKKSDYLPQAFSQLLEKNSVASKDIKEVYVTKGPGSFMGVRAGLMFALTFAATRDIKMFVASSLDFISKGKDGKYYWEAKSNQSYFLEVPNKEITLVEAQENSFVDYEDFTNNPLEYLKVFEESNPLTTEALYVKEPRVG